MTVTFDPSNDWQYMDGLTQNLYQPRTDEGDFGTFVNAMMLRREDNKTSVQGTDYEYLATHVAVWEVWKTSFDTDTPPVPRAGDQFQAGGPAGNNPWTVQAVDYCTLLSRYRLHATQEGQGS